MKKQEHSARFQIISGVKRNDITAETFVVPNPNAQVTLFPTPRPGLLIFVFFPDVTEDEFKKTLELAKPAIVVELRNTPRFDIGRLNRHIVFQYFDREHSKYLDLTSKRVDQSHFQDLVSDVKAAFQTEHIRFDKPIMFLLSRFNSPSNLSDQIIDVVADIKRSQPEVLAIPHFSSGARSSTP